MPGPPQSTAARANLDAGCRVGGRMAAFPDNREEFMDAYSTVDIFAVGFFILEWTVYAVTLEHTAYGRDSLSARMNAYR
jgi:hypothetical protein